MKISRILVVIILVVAVSSCKKQKQSANETSSETVAVQVAKPEKITVVTLPDGWTKVEGSVLEHQYGKGTASFMIKNEYALNGRGLDEAVREAKEQIGKYFDNADFSDIETIRIGGQDARSITYTYTVKAAGMNMSMKMQGVYVMLNSKCYLISFGDMESSFDALAPHFEQILNGIQFEN